MPHRPDAIDVAQSFGRLFDDVEDSLAERFHQLLRINGADALDHAGAQVALDALQRCGWHHLQEGGVELETMLSIVVPFAAGVDVFAGLDRGRRADERHQIALPARLDAQDAESGLRAVEGDPFHQSGEYFLVFGCNRHFLVVVGSPKDKLGANVADENAGVDGKTVPDLRHLPNFPSRRLRMIEPVVRLRVELQNIEPKIWRRVDVPLSSTLAALHDIIQVAFGWHDAHIWEFRVGDVSYGLPDPDEMVLDARKIRLKKLIDGGVERLEYIYDFGDNWEHRIVVEEVRDGEADVDYPAFVDGARRAPPEDCGGPPGFMDFLEAVLDVGHPDHSRVLEWYGRPFDLNDIGEGRLRRVMSVLAARRRGGLAKGRRGKGEE